MKSRLVSRIALAIFCLVLTITIATTECLANAASSSYGLLPRNYVVLLNLVNQHFNSITQQDSTGEDSTAQGDPDATRAVFFVNDHGLQKVTITVDRYRNSSDATSAYQTALQKSEEVPGFEPIPIPSVGQQSFAGSVTQDGETHVGLGAQDGNFVFGATLAGFDATPDNVANLVGLARAENAAIDAARSATNCYPPFGNHRSRPD